MSATDTARTALLKKLLEAGVHFGHQKNRWNPKMKKYIFGARNGIYIIDLDQTATAVTEACKLLKEIVETGGKVLFVGTKKQAQDVIKEAAERTEMFYVNERWLGGMLTNFQTIQKSINRLLELEKMRDDGTFDVLSKKEVSQLTKEMYKLAKNLNGVREMKEQPDAIFIIDVKTEDIALKEAVKLNIPVIALVDTNSNPDTVNHVIPGNDDAIRSVKLVTSLIADSIAEGREKYIKEYKPKLEAEQAAREAEKAKEAEKAAKEAEKKAKEAKKEEKGTKDKAASSKKSDKSQDKSKSSEAKGEKPVDELAKEVLQVENDPAESK